MPGPAFVCSSCGNMGRLGRWPADRLLPTAAFHFQTMNDLGVPAYECRRCGAVSLPEWPDLMFLRPYPGVETLHPATQSQLATFLERADGPYSDEVQPALDWHDQWDQLWVDTVGVLWPRPEDTVFHGAVQLGLIKGHSAISMFSLQAMADILMRRERGIVASERELIDELSHSLWAFRQGASGTTVNALALWESMTSVTLGWLEECLTALEEPHVDAGP